MSALVEIIEANLAQPAHQEAILALTDGYARDPMGGGEPLSAYAREHLIAGLRAHPAALVLLAFCEGEPAGLATCFLGFSTFAAKPLLNIHDLAVAPAQRGRGIARALLEATAEAARARGCCKLTLEVLENNDRALGVYRAAGFTQAAYAEEAGGALFFTRPL